MPNFDSLRSSIIAPLEYICRPKEKPAELLGCWPLDSDLEDKSRYGGTFASTITSHTTKGTWNLLDCQNATHSCTLGTPLRYGDPWSIELMLFTSNKSAGYSYGVGDVAFRVHWNDYPRNRCIYQGNRLYEDAIETNQILVPTSITYDGSTIRWYVKGLIYYSKTTTLASTNISNISLVLENAEQYIGNFRVVQKCLGDGSTYPVPSSPFTGYESL